MPELYHDTAYYEEKATQIAERYGIIDYEVYGNEMHYGEVFPLEKEVYYCIINLDTLKERRKAFHK